MLDENEIERRVREARLIGVVGMQDERKKDRPAYLIPEALQRFGYRVIPVNPLIEASLGEKAYPDLASLPARVDILDVFRRPEAIPALALEILALPEDRRPKLVWLQSGITDPESEERLAAAGLAVVSDRCLGVYASRVRPVKGR